MDFHRFAKNKLTQSFIANPYSLLQHYKRAYKLLEKMKTLEEGHKKGASVLVLGDKHRFEAVWEYENKKRTLGDEGLRFTRERLDEKAITSASKYHDLIICLDPVLFAKSLHRINLPVMTVATAEEIHEHPEILDMTDYLLPTPDTKYAQALRVLVAKNNFRI